MQEIFKTWIHLVLLEEKNFNKNWQGKEIPFPFPVKTKTRGQIPDGSPIVAISSPTDMTAAFAEAKEGYM